MLARYIVIAIYGLDTFFGKDVIFLVFDKKNNSVYNYFEAIVKLSNVAMNLITKFFIAIFLLKQRRHITTMILI
ncbi:Uncharacterised protein [Salmonella enterica]|uniref:Uncharacterized protein n=1 Tax=Salmonella enterica TaxID=28901 RepID=A0A7D8EPX8_SALER|nr:Uncharacterised protein [Salmonella enterica]